mmetsp:Transcript_17709/g.36763  ORF Transcript_17709/g.36763 Transcript_17709/m.36763 type:complete len:133 (-) Transcript_17709:4305-4703(-)
MSSSAMMGSLIFLIQTEETQQGRTFLDFTCHSEAMDGLCGFYESRLRMSQPRQKNLRYTAKELLSFLDQLPQLACFSVESAVGGSDIGFSGNYQGHQHPVHHPMRTYEMHDKDWIKRQLLDHLRRKCSAGLV